MGFLHCMLKGQGHEIITAWKWLNRPELVLPLDINYIFQLSQIYIIQSIINFYIVFAISKAARGSAV